MDRFLAMGYVVNDEPIFIGGGGPRDMFVHRAASKIKEVLGLNSTVSAEKTNKVSGALIDHDRYVIGTDRGLLYVDHNREEIARVGLIKAISQVEYVLNEELLVVICGKKSIVHLVPVQALDGKEVKWIKLGKTEGCSSFTIGVWKEDDSRPVHILCVAVKRKVVVYEITQNKARHKRIRDLQLPSPAQSLNVISGGRIIIGYRSGFTVYNLNKDNKPCTLYQPEQSLVAFHQPLDALCAVEMSEREYLLVFSLLAVYVDVNGRRSRERDITYSARPEAIVHCSGHLLIYTETHIDVVDCSSGLVIQTLHLKQSRPLNYNGLLAATFVTEKPYIVYLRNVHTAHLGSDGGDDKCNQPKTRRDLSVLSSTEHRSNFSYIQTLTDSVDVHKT